MCDSMVDLQIGIPTRVVWWVRTRMEVQYSDICYWGRVMVVGFPLVPATDFLVDTQMIDHYK